MPLWHLTKKTRRQSSANSYSVQVNNAAKINDIENPTFALAPLVCSCSTSVIPPIAAFPAPAEAFDFDPSVIDKAVVESGFVDPPVSTKTVVEVSFVDPSTSEIEAVEDVMGVASRLDKKVEDMGAVDPSTTDAKLVAGVETAGVVISRLPVLIVVLIMDVLVVVEVVLVVVEVVEVVVHFEQVHACGPSNTSLLTPSLQQDWVWKL